MKLSSNTLHRNAYFLDPTENVDVLKDSNCVDLFDQNGYHLTKAEQTYLPYNGYNLIERRHEETCL